jgi:hypothetical protein
VARTSTWGRSIPTVLLASSSGEFQISWMHIT